MLRGLSVGAVDGGFVEATEALEAMDGSREEWYADGA